MQMRPLALNNGVSHLLEQRLDPFLGSSISHETASCGGAVQVRISWYSDFRTR